MNHRTKTGPTPRIEMRLINGPYHGQYLPDKPYSGTLDFTAKGQSGYYNESGVWYNTGNVHQLQTQKAQP